MSEFTKSVDYKAYSDFMIDGSEKDYRKDALDRNSSNAFHGKSKQEESVDAFRDGMKVIDQQREAQEEKLRKFNGISYTDADLEKTIKDIIDDKEAFASKHGLSDDEADRAEYYALVMADMSPEKRDQYLKEIVSSDPAVASAIATDLEMNKLERENAMTANVSYSTSIEADNIVSELTTSDDDLLNGSGQKETFTLDM